MRNQSSYFKQQVQEARAIRKRFLGRIDPAESFLRLLDFMPDVAFFAKDRQFRLMCGNRRFLERFGLKDEDELVGRTDFELFPARLAESFRKDDEEVLSSGQPKLNIVELFFTDQGVPDWFVTNKLPILDRAGKVIGIMGLVHSYEGRKEVLKPYLQLDKAVTYIRQNFRRAVSVTELAELVHLSPRQLHRKFVETFGASPQAFVLKLKIQAACEALQAEGAQISEVARAVGFRDQSAFTQHFHKHVGVTPLKYVQRYRLVRRGGE
jgi:PAS domain S-box-containing protein